MVEKRKFRRIKIYGKKLLNPEVQFYKMHNEENTNLDQKLEVYDVSGGGLRLIIGNDCKMSLRNVYEFMFKPQLNKGYTNMLPSELYGYAQVIAFGFYRSLNKDYMQLRFVDPNDKHYHTKEIEQFIKYVHYCDLVLASNLSYKK